MSSDFDFSTYLFLSKNKIIISVYKENDFEKVYEKELIINEQFNHINYQELDKFLNENIFRIEKILDNFVKKITIIFDIDEFFFVELSIKKKDSDNLINLKSLNYLLYEAKENCKKTIDDKRIIHLIIRNFPSLI